MKIAHSDPVNKAVSFPEPSQGLVARQNKFFKTFLPFNFIKCLAFTNISRWQRMSPALCAVSWNMKQDIKFWTETVPSVWKLLFNLSYFGEENDSRKLSVHTDCDTVGGWHGSSLISFQLEIFTACN